MLPPPELAEAEGLVIVRDDRLPGGTKRRALITALQAGREYVYASPAMGYAQVALAYAAQDVGAAATIVTAKRREPSALTRQAQAAGARVLLVPAGYLTHIEAQAKRYAASVGAELLPFGLDTPAVREALAAVARALPVDPAEVWTVAGSGMFTRALQAAWPRAQFHAVQIGRPPQVGMAQRYQAPERFEQPAQEPPPFPSAAYYDAKAWRFVRQGARLGALFWNVGG